MNNKKSNDLPIEVKLIHQVKSCRKCKWFWGGVPPYGPYPSYNWNQTFPPEVKTPPKQETGSMPPIKWLEADAAGYQLIDPAVMHGCRKAPIMTIGINPNLTSFATNTKGARWAYPHFDEDEKYAYYYRHQTIFQESFDMEVIRKHLKPGSEVMAEKSGWIKDYARGTDHRFMLITLHYEDETEETIELAWTPQARYVLFYDKPYTPAGEEPVFEGEPMFKKGDCLAGLLEAPKDTQVEVYENNTGYYQRFIYVLEKFKEMAGGELAEADLTIGEDVAQHDFIGCASPGWSSKYDMPFDCITQNCVNTKGYVVSQILQSQPKVLVIVGGSSVEMFGQAMGPHMSMDLEYKDKDIYQLLKETTERERYLTIKTDTINFRSRIIASPHFSYSDNFVEQSRFSAEAWQAFQKDFNDDYKTLEKAGRVRKPGYGGVIPVRIKGKNDEIKETISAAGWGVIMAYYYEPFTMMASVLMELYKKESLTFNKETGHLTRTDDSCRYCVNDQWQFPEGCPYGKDKEEPLPAGIIEQAMKTILETNK